MKKLTLSLALALAVASSAANLTAPAWAQDMPSVFQPQISPMVGAHAAAQQDVIQSVGKRRKTRAPRTRTTRTNRRYYGRYRVFNGRTRSRSNSRPRPIYRPRKPYRFG